MQYLCKQVSCFRCLGDSFAVIPYALFNIFSVVTIIVANKAVFKMINFHFPTVLMCIHTTITCLGLAVRAHVNIIEIQHVILTLIHFVCLFVLWQTASCLGLFERKSFPCTPLLIMSVSFVFYNVVSDSSMQL